MDEALRRKNPDEERINVPANSRHYWRYRMHLDIEDLMEAVELNNRINSLESNNYIQNALTAQTQYFLGIYPPPAAV